MGRNRGQNFFGKLFRGVCNVLTLGLFGLISKRISRRNQEFDSAPVEPSSYDTNSSTDMTGTYEEKTSASSHSSRSASSSRAKEEEIPDEVYGEFYAPELEDDPSDSNEQEDEEEYGMGM